MVKRAALGGGDGAVCGNPGGDHDGVGGRGMVGGEAYVWRGGRAEVTLSRADDTWTVVYTSAGRLLGPRQEIYRGQHRDATHAAWDVMARVVLASRDEDEGLRAGQSAAQWIKAQRQRGRQISGSPGQR